VFCEVLRPACLSVCVSVHVTYMAVRRWRHCDTLCTSGFMDGVLSVANNNQELATQNDIFKETHQ